MKHLFYNILFIACALLCFACGAEDDPAALGGKGYLRLSVGQSNELTTKADEEYKFDRIERICAKIICKACSLCYFRFVNAQFVNDNCFYFRCNF